MTGYRSLVLVLLGLWLNGSAAGAEKRPNILFLFADDWGRYASVYAKVDGPGTPGDVVRTPNIDRVAAEGVLFRNAFVTAPSCTPCRSSLLSGQYFWRTGRGAVLHGAIWDEKIPTYPLLLREAGYQIGKSYKVWSPGTPADAPFGGQQYAYERSGRRFNQFSQEATKMVARGKSVEEAKAILLDEVTGNFQKFLADRDDDKPFCFWFGPTNVHRTWTQGSGKKLWGIEPDDLKGKLPPFLPDVPEVREDFADYLGEVQAFDAAVGRLTDALQKAGELDNTVIVISGDHGAPGFPHGKCNLYDFGVGVALIIKGPSIAGGRVVDDFVNLMDLAPTFLQIGGVTPPDVMTGRSLLPVLQSEKEGLVDPKRTWVVTGRERHVASARAGNLPYPQRALRTKDYLYIVNFAPERWPMGDPLEVDSDSPPSANELEFNTYAAFKDMDAGPTKAWVVTHRLDSEWKPFYDLAFRPRPREELYVLASDPQEMHNVAAEPDMQAIRQELNQQLMAELKRTEDPRVTGDGRTYERPPFTDPFTRKPKQR